MAKSAKCLFFILFSLTSLGAVAQCATGVNTGGGNCVPPDAAGMPDYRAPNAETNAPAPTWKDSWGAIALDTVDGAKGVSTNAETKRDAVRAAMDECIASGTAHCKVELTYRNQCAAVAWGEHAYGIGNNPTLEGASRNALNACSQEGPGCSVVYTACSMQRRVR